MRSAKLSRTTGETEITMTLTLDSGEGRLSGSTGIGFFDHMLNSFCTHGCFNLALEMQGDLFVDGHHTVEDVGIVLGQLFAEILGDKRGIARFGDSLVPMDESLARAVVDISGRPYLVFDADPTAPMVGAYDTQLTKEFFRALAYNMGATLHLSLLYGDNEHHRCEALFKAAARAISQASKITGETVLSTKGVL
ncbi:MAG: imidazoleglycerol-phosphate dehydratase HisB [Clostridiales bacterium]|nr:imidazoleglycerol-phosphate dehydratase HisB [Clostridiales bacterium]